jgi:hypothetical protein
MFSGLNFLIAHLKLLNHSSSSTEICVSIVNYWTKFFHVIMKEVPLTTNLLYNQKMWQWLAFLFCILEVPDSNHRVKTAFSGFPQSLHANVTTYLKLGHDCYTPHTLPKMRIFICLRSTHYSKKTTFFCIFCYNPMKSVVLTTGSSDWTMNHVTTWCSQQPSFWVH